MEQIKESVEISTPSASKKVLQMVSCIYIPCSDPDRTMNWFRAQFQFMTSDRPWLTLANGTDLMFIKTADDTRMKYKAESWDDVQNAEVPMLMFQVEDIEELHSSMKQNGAEVEEIRDNGGCGLEFYFYDPEGNKYVAWEMQTEVFRKEDKIVFGNCYFEGSASEFLAKVSAKSRGSSKKVRFRKVNKLKEKDPEGLQKVVDLLHEFNVKHPGSISMMGL